MLPIAWLGPPAVWRNDKFKGQFWGFSSQLIMNCTAQHLAPIRKRLNRSRWTKFRPIETNWTCSICFDFVEISFDIVAKTGNVVAKNGNNVEATFDFVGRIVRLVAFDNVASTLLLMWTGLYAAAFGQESTSGARFTKKSYDKRRNNLG